MKLKSLMPYAVPIIIIFMILGFLVVVFTLDNSQAVKLKYHIPFTSFQIPRDQDFIEIDLVLVILISILIGIVVMSFFVAIAGIGWRYYDRKRNREKRRERKFLWEKREEAIADSLKGFHLRAIDRFEHIKRIIDKDNNPPNEIYIGLAEAYERQGNQQKAIENYNAVLSRTPRNMRALFGAAKNWESLGNYDDAVKLYDVILDDEADSPEAIRKRQELLEQSGRYLEAIEAYQRSRVTFDSQETQEILASLYYRLAVKQLKDGDLKGAEQTLKESRREHSFYVPNILLLANLYMNIDREREARKLWEQTAKETLSTIIFRRLEEYYYSQKGNPQENLEPVIKLYKELIESRDADHLCLALGKLYLKLEIFDEAEKALLEFQSKDPSIPQVHLLLAELYHHTDNVDKALEEYRFASELVDRKIADFKCFKCGAMYEYWADQCTSCKRWGTIEDIFFTEGPKSVLPELRQKPVPQLPIPSGEDTEEKVVSVS